MLTHDKHFFECGSTGPRSRVSERKKVLFGIEEDECLIATIRAVAKDASAR